MAFGAQNLKNGAIKRLPPHRRGIMLYQIKRAECGLEGKMFYTMQIRYQSSTPEYNSKASTILYPMQANLTRQINKMQRFPTRQIQERNKYILVIQQPR